VELELEGYLTYDRSVVSIYNYSIC